MHGYKKSTLVALSLLVGVVLLAGTIVVRRLIPDEYIGAQRAYFSELEGQLAEFDSLTTGQRIAFIVPVRRRPQDWEFSLHGVQDPVGLERVDGLDERQTTVQAEPFFGMAMPLDVEAVAADPVEAGEWGIELLAEIVWEAGAVALDESILRAVPFAADIDRIVELCWSDYSQESRLQEFADQSLARCGDDGLFRLGEPGHWFMLLRPGSPRACANSTGAVPRA